jgi:hypothetical protein
MVLHLSRKKSEKISIPTFECLKIKNPIFFGRYYVFVIDFTVLQLVINSTNIFLQLMLCCTLFYGNYETIEI